MSTWKTVKVPAFEGKLVYNKVEDFGGVPYVRVSIPCTDADGKHHTSGWWVLLPVEYVELPS